MRTITLEAASLRLEHCGGPRCHRLGKPCRPSTAVRKSVYRAKKPTSTSDWRVRVLEERVDEVVSLLKTVPSLQQGTANPSGTDSLLAAADHGLSTSSNEGAHRATPVVAHAAPLAHSESDHVAHTSTAGLLNSAWLHPNDAKEYLETFRTQFLQFLPFVYVSDSTTPQWLQQERPFLWLCITAICTKSPAQQDVLGGRIRDVIAREVVAEGERSIDLLLGLLAFIIW